MRIYISFVIQGSSGHKHASEVLQLDSPAYTYTSDIPVARIMEWAETQQKSLPEDQKLVIISILQL